MKPLAESLPDLSAGNNLKTKKRKLFKSSQENDTAEINSSEDFELYKKIFNRCKDLTKKLTSMGNEKYLQEKNCQRHHIFYSEENLSSSLDETAKSNKSIESNQDKGPVQNYNYFNEQLLAMECIFNMQLNKQHNVPVDWYKNELRLNKIFDKVLLSLGDSFNLIKTSKSFTCAFYLNKYLRYFNFLECIMQSSTSALASFNILHSEENVRKKNLKAITSGNENDIPTSVLNQNYLIHFENKYLTSLIKE